MTPARTGSARFAPDRYASVRDDPRAYGECSLGGVDVPLVVG